MEKIQYSPTLFLRSKTPTKYTTIDNKYLAPMKFDTISDCRKFIDQYKDVDNFEMYGNKRFEHAFISETFVNEVSFDQSLIQTDNIDIECRSDDGFPLPEIANQEITAITLKRDNHFYVFGCKNFVKNRDDITFYKCNDEKQLLMTFLHVWASKYPDIITGWNVQEFDMIYLYNRIKNILGENYAKKLSPWNMVLPRSKIIMFGGQAKTIHFVDIYGISTLDYLVMFKKLSPSGNQESYSLDHIAHVVTGARKLSYEEYGSLRRLYDENPQRFYEYNIRDVELVVEIDKKQNLLRLALMLAYDAKCNYEEVFGQVRVWTQICHDYLFHKKKIIAPLLNDVPEDSAPYEGAFVKEPQVGLHHDILSIDAEALYPSIIQCFNISPETLVRVDPVDLNKLITNTVQIDDDTLTMCGNGARFLKNKQGFMVELVDHYKIRRKQAKAKMLEYEKEYEKTKDDKFKALIETYDARQSAMKVALNSLYGALGNKYFMFYDERLAKAITLTGQYIILSIEKNVNEYLNKLHSNEDTIQYCFYCDTDSVYIELSPIIDKFFPDKKGIERIECMNKIYNQIFDKKFKEISVNTTQYLNAFRNDIIFKREILGDRGIWTAKKRYIVNVWDKEGVRYDKPKIVIKGLEVKKSSTPQIIKDYLNEAIKIIINKTEDDLVKFIKEKRKEYMQLPIEDISSPRGVNNVTKYRIGDKSVPIHVYGALVFNKEIEKRKLTREYEKIKDGEKIKFIYLKEPNTFQSHVISFVGQAPKEFEINEYIDYNKQFEKTFIAPLQTITDPIGWKTEKKISLKTLGGKK